MGNRTLSVSFVSGKGGVGKTNLALNIAYALHQQSYSTLLMDCDMGLANLDVLLGITPEGNIQDVLLNNATINDVICKIEAQGLDVLPAASGVPEMVDLDPDMRKLLVNRLNTVLHNYDYIFMDLGAGITDMVQAFAAMSTMRLVVVTPEPTSLTDSYALIKVLSTRYNIRDFMVIVNQVENKKEETRTFECLYSACSRFLKIQPVLLGSVRTDPKLMEAVRMQKPLMAWADGSPAGVDIQELAVRIQQHRLAMIDYLADKDILRLPQE